MALARGFCALQTLALHVPVVQNVSFAALNSHKNVIFQAYISVQHATSGSRRKRFLTDTFCSDIVVQDFPVNCHLVYNLRLVYKFCRLI